MATRVALSGAMGVLLLTLAAGARAQTEPDEEAHLRSGVALRREHRDAEALDEFRLAYERGHSARALAQMGLAEDSLEQYAEAESDLTKALEATTDRWVARNDALLRDALAELARHLGTLEVVCEAPSAEVSVDGRPAGPSPVTRRVTAGVFAIDVRAPGYAPVHQVVTSVMPGTTRVVVALAPLPPSPPFPPSAPSAAVPTQRSASVLAQAPASAPHASGTRATAAWITLAGAGVILAAAGIATAVRESALAKYNDDRQCSFGGVPRDVRCGDARGTFETANTLMILGFTAGGIAAGAGALLALAAHGPGATVGGRLACAPDGVLAARCSVAF